MSEAIQATITRNNNKGLKQEGGVLLYCASPFADSVRPDGRMALPESRRAATIFDAVFSPCFSQHRVTIQPGCNSQLRVTKKYPYGWAAVPCSMMTGRTPTPPFCFALAKSSDPLSPKKDPI